MALQLATSGITFSYAVEVTAGTRPTTASAWNEIDGVKSLPELRKEPSTLEVTELKETNHKKYIKGLEDVPTEFAITVNDYDDFRTDWTALMTAYTTAKASGKAAWFMVKVPDLSSNNCFYFSGEPIALGFGGAEVDAVLENTAYIIPNNLEGWGTAPTA